MTRAVFAFIAVYLVCCIVVGGIVWGVPKVLSSIAYEHHLQSEQQR